MLCKVAFAAFHEAGVRYAVNGGGLLGWARNGGLMPFDDDVDVVVPLEDQKQMQDFDWGSHGLTLVRGDLSGLWKLCFAKRVPGDLDLLNHLNGRSFGTLKKWRWPFVDIFLMERHGSTRHLVGACRKQWPNEKMDAAFDVKSVSLRLCGRAVSVKVPRAHAQYLNAAYGSDWRRFAKLPNFNHRDNRMVSRSQECKDALYHVGGVWAKV